MTQRLLAAGRGGFSVVLLVVVSALVVLGAWVSRYGIQAKLDTTQGELLVADGSGQLAAAAEEPALLLLNADALVTTVNGGTVNLTARVRDAEGNPVQGAAIQFASGQGTVAPASANTDANGLATTTFTAGGTEGQAIVTAKVGDLPVREAAIQIVKPNNDATAFTLSLQPGAGKLDPGQSTNVTAVLRDGTGAPLAGQVVSVFGSMGQVSAASAVSDGNGRVSFTYQAGSAAGQGMITALAGYASASTTLQIGTISGPGGSDHKQFLPLTTR